MEEFEQFVKNNKDIITKSQGKDRNSLVFAFVGDAVFGLYVRGLLASVSTAKAGVLHGLAVKFVRASYQSQLLDKIWDKLYGEEQQIATNARNEKTNNVAKNSNLAEYKESTSFEAVVGYLYITNQTQRLFEVLELCRVFILQDLKNTK